MFTKISHMSTLSLLCVDMLVAEICHHNRNPLDMKWTLINLINLIVCLLYEQQYDARYKVDLNQQVSLLMEQQYNASIIYTEIIHKLIN